MISLKKILKFTVSILFLNCLTAMENKKQKENLYKIKKEGNNLLKRTGYKSLS